jgi:hypothetical protein
MRNQTTVPGSRSFTRKKANMFIHLLLILAAIIAFIYMGLSQ